ncbi:hypothetical protein K435DRAFT_965581 [Dendrothele bispora CBS 962.96]|uniref:Microbial-type PARG catalytic domain-containing protein n=1 Tax=Dendrothele bispora (strain CBS 962.96) TaxID=1314807 RepID=A0A4S8M4Y2_DENBC|nr:hypothetical protein K435DRAFT_965581 [Dendrothele bispora CBS 962.96]
MEARQRIGVDTSEQRHHLAWNTIKRSPEIVSEHAGEGATDTSTFHKDQMPPLDASACPYPDKEPTSVDVINIDSFRAARDILNAEPDAQGKMAVLNLASDLMPGGPWLRNLTKTQEEALCYSSTLYITLKEEYYPWPNLGPGSVAGIFSPAVVIFRDDLDHKCVELPRDERRIVSVITVAAPRGPALTLDKRDFANASELESLRGKIRLVYRTAAHNGQRYLVLGAMGCGAYRCPPRAVAQEMKNILLDPEFKGWFKKVVFAVYSSPGNGAKNFAVFSEIFEDVKV